MMSAAPASEKEENRCDATRDLWSDANIAGSPNVGRHWPVVTTREEM